MEGGVPDLPLWVAALARLYDAALCMSKLVEGRDDLALPNFVAVPQCKTKDLRLDELPGLGQIVEILLFVSTWKPWPSKTMNCSAASPASASRSELMLTP